MNIHKIKLNNLTVENGVLEQKANEDNSVDYLFSKESATFSILSSSDILPLEVLEKSKYLYFDMKVHDDLCALIKISLYKKDSEIADMEILFTVLPQVKTRVSLQLSILDAQVMFQKPTPGGLKQVLFGTKIDLDEIDKITLSAEKRFRDLKVTLWDINFTDEEVEYQLENKILCDKYGQSLIRNYGDKIHSDDELLKYIESKREKAKELNDFRYSEYGGYLDKKVSVGTGFFTTYKDENRWWLVDPSGYAFISTGFDCVSTRNMASRVTGMEEYYEHLEENLGVYQDAWSVENGTDYYHPAVANLIRCYGENWKKVWKEMTYNRLKSWGINTIAAWSDYDFAREYKMPYAFSLDTYSPFPTTDKKIFRDFPDVFSKEYELKSDEYASYLKDLVDDKYMIGYFMRNEPQWAFVEDICIAEQMLAYEGVLVSKTIFIEKMIKKYETISNLNKAWNKNFESFDSLYKENKNACNFSEEAKKDLKEFSEDLIRKYVELPAKACKKYDKNHLNLGMRYAYITDKSIISGWENFDVFSINSYQISPYKQIEQVAEFVNIPVMIGEFHFGAAESDLFGTGLKSVRTQKDRGTAYKYYMSEMIRHPLMVGAHYFKYEDQALLGRSDGENHPIGIIDVKQRPYPEFVESIIEFNKNLLDIAQGKKEEYTEMADAIPRIAN